ncbi:hypothetical protein QOZ80_3AG0222720 [Eleusine coracana subsp. coracana]|nr:hypothetical protein QOZ80_3AG0222720 [Eleusine coracana subsp. coracana]
MREKSFLEACSGNPFIVGFHSLVRAPDYMELRLVMEHVGPSLRDVLLLSADDDPPFSEVTVRGIMWQLLTGAKKMHELHVMHHKIKPENILVDMDQCHGQDLRLRAGPAHVRHTVVRSELIDGYVLFHALNDEGQLCAIIDVLGVPNARVWPWLSSTPFANGLLLDLRYAWRRSLLHKGFPEMVLFEQGFKVLNSLLTWNPDKRLMSSCAPWKLENAQPAHPGKQ